ncbi:MAG: hypothetical protein K6T83_19250, partial [Alicyclobacillus sp.]|nr:hypothetical protein [Alicyclobacillus sp.]
SAKPVPELMGFQTVLSAKLTGGLAAIVEGSDTFTPKFTAFLVRHVLSHTRTLPLLDEPIFEQQEGARYVGLV